MTDLYARAAAIFGTGPSNIRWPYDVSGIDHTLRRTNPDKFKQQLDELNAKREVIIAWAERHGLKGSSSGCCPKWLQRKVSRRCGAGPCRRCMKTMLDGHQPQCSAGPCTYYAGGVGSADRDWLDHRISWLKDGRPAAITSAPYHVSDTDEARIAWWLAEDSRFRCVRGAGWYGFGTSQVVMWRADRIPVIEAAGLPGRIAA